jgi:hypothetical protein
VTEELHVRKIKWALPSHRCSQRIRVKGDKGGTCGGGAAWPARGGREGTWHGRSDRNNHSAVARS